MLDSNPIIEFKRIPDIALIVEQKKSFVKREYEKILLKIKMCHSPEFQTMKLKIRSTKQSKSNKTETEVEIQNCDKIQRNYKTRSRTLNQKKQLTLVIERRRICVERKRKVWLQNDSHKLV